MKSDRRRLLLARLQAQQAVLLSLLGRMEELREAILADEPSSPLGIGVMGPQAWSKKARSAIHACPRAESDAFAVGADEEWADAVGRWSPHSHVREYDA